MKIYVMIAAFTAFCTNCSSVIYKICPRHRFSDSDLAAIEIGKTHLETLEEKAGPPVRVGHKADGNLIRVYRYSGPYPGSFSTLRLETDRQNTIVDYEYLRTNDIDIGANQIYERYHVFRKEE